jgi:maltose O-acetyltransferase
MRFSIANKSVIFMGCKFDCKGGFSMGKNSVINADCSLDCRGGISIGDNVSISKAVNIITADHDLNSPQFEGRQKPVIIEDYVWIGTRAMILPGCTIGKGAVVAAGAVVTKNVPAFSVIAGVPARIIKSRITDLDYTLYYRRLFQ